MRYSFAFGDNPSPWLRAMEAGLDVVMRRHGHEPQLGSPVGADLVFYGATRERPRPFRRQAKATFVVSVLEGTEMPPDPLAALYPVLVRTLSNLLIYGGPSFPRRAYLVTPELGRYAVEASDDATWFEALYERISPLATSHLVIDNIFDEDLPADLWNGTAVTDQMRDAARVLDQWDLFPTPYPIQDLLDPDDYRHLKHVFGIGGLSYGNLSARHDRHRFWMSASGVDKGKIGTVSRDILLVKGYDAALNAIRLSVAPGSRPLRVSVDAVEHWVIYESHPEIGAIIHIHAWVDDIPTTSVNYPCGTVEMGYAMTELLNRDPHPERTIIGLKNHGITATGPDFPDILQRLQGRVRRTVPML
jgi:hypothetical protein